MQLCVANADAQSPTGESNADVLIEHGNLADCSRVLQLKEGLLLNAQHHRVLALDADLWVIVQQRGPYR